MHDGAGRRPIETAPTGVSAARGPTLPGTVRAERMP